MDTKNASLQELRDRLGAIDRELIEKIAERQQIVAAIGAVKLKSGQATRDYRQEREVIHRARQTASGLGVDANLAEEIMLSLIRGSLTLQEQGRVAAVDAGEGKRALIIGGAGEMGRWFARFLRSQGFSVEIADPAGEVAGFTCISDYRSSSLAHDLIIVSAPLRISGEILEDLAQRKPPGIIFDVGSLKSPLREGLGKLVAAGCRVTSIHPMFGPGTELLSGRHIIFIDLGCAEANELAQELFASTMAERVEMDLESHDRLIAYVLGLSHALNIAFFTALAESGEAAPKLARLSSTTFDAQLDVARKVAAENPHLYFEIQRLNDYGTESLSALLYAVERLRSMVRAGDEEAFVQLMQQGLGYLTSQPFGGSEP
jgi:chorismate mutase/prephenate dehydrogenase